MKKSSVVLLFVMVTSIAGCANEMQAVSDACKSAVLEKDPSIVVNDAKMLEAAKEIRSGSFQIRSVAIISSGTGDEREQTFTCTVNVTDGVAIVSKLEFNYSTIE